MSLRFGKAPLVRRTLSGKTFAVESINNVVLDVAVSPDGEFVAFGGANGIVGLLKAKDEMLTVRWLSHKGVDVTAVEFVGSDMLLSGDASGTLVLWDVRKGRQIASDQGHLKQVISVAVAPDGSEAVASGKGGLLYRWSLASRSLQDATRIEFNSENDIACVRYAPDGKSIAFSEDKTDKVYKLEFDGGRPRPIVWGSGQVYSSIAFSPDGRRLAAGSFDSTITIVNYTNGDPLLTLKKDNNPVKCVCFSSDGVILVCGTAGGTLRCWE
jgi:WD40 repeat protein